MRAKYRGFTLGAAWVDGCIIVRDRDGWVLWDTVALDEVATSPRRAIAYMKQLVDRHLNREDA